MTFRQVLAFGGVVVTAVSMFVPWIYAFSPPSGPNGEISMVASPNLIDLVFHSNYGYLWTITLSVAGGILFLVVPARVGKVVRVPALAAALGLSSIPGFIFGLQYGAAFGLILDGSYVSYSITLGPGIRLIELSSGLFFLALFAEIFSD